jgi:hypothetical protein
MRGARGQATVDYLGVVLVVALVVGAAAALLVTTDLGQRVVAAFERALCIVTGGPCDEVDVACVTSSDEHARETHVNAVIFRIGHRWTELRERHPDGTVTVTLVSAGEGGLDFGTGVGAQVRWGRFGYAVGSELRFAALAEHATGRTWTVRDDAAASALVRRVTRADISRRPRPGIAGAPSMAPLPLAVHAPSPEQTFSQRGEQVGIDWQGGAGAHGFLGQAYGERVDARSGARTIYVRSSGGLALSAGSRLAAAAQGGEEERYGITFDRQRRPVDFEVLSSYTLDASVGQGSQVGRVLGPRLEAGEHVETEQHLDLTDPQNAQMVEAFLRAFGTRAGLGLAAHALRDRIDRDGSSRMRAYDTSSTAHEVAGQARLDGVGIGGQTGTEDSSERLVAAAVREPGGAWRADPACAPR